MSYGDHSHPIQDCRSSGAGTATNRQSLAKFAELFLYIYIYRQNNGAVSLEAPPELFEFCFQLSIDNNL